MNFKLHIGLAAIIITSFVLMRGQGRLRLGHWAAAPAQNVGSAPGPGGCLRLRLVGLEAPALASARGRWLASGGWHPAACQCQCHWQCSQRRCHRGRRTQCHWPALGSPSGWPGAAGLFPRGLGARRPGSRSGRHYQQPRGRRRRGPRCPSSHPAPGLSVARAAEMRRSCGARGWQRAAVLDRVA